MVDNRQERLSKLLQQLDEKAAKARARGDKALAESIERRADRVANSLASLAKRPHRH